MVSRCRRSSRLRKQNKQQRPPTLIRRCLPRCCRRFPHPGSQQPGRRTRSKTVDCREEGRQSWRSVARKSLIKKGGHLVGLLNKIEAKGTNLSVQLPKLDHGAPGARRDLIFITYLISHNNSHHRLPIPRTWRGGTHSYLSVLVIGSRARPSAVVVPVPRRKELPRLVLRLGGQPLLLRLSGGLVLFMGLESGAAGLRSDEGSVPKSLVGVPRKRG